MTKCGGGGSNLFFFFFWGEGGWVDHNLFIYQARGVYSGPNRVSDSPVAAENIIYEAFVFGGNWVLLLLTAFLEERGSIGKLE